MARGQVWVFAPSGKRGTPTPSPSLKGGEPVSEAFTGAALRLAALAAAYLRWTPRIFWNATPSELTASLAPPLPGETPPSRAEIAALIERDSHG